MDQIAKETGWSVGTVHKDIETILPEYTVERDEDIQEKRKLRLVMDSVIIEELQEKMEQGEADMSDVVAYDKAREREAKMLQLYERRPDGQGEGKGTAAEVVDILNAE